MYPKTWIKNFNLGVIAGKIVLSWARNIARSLIYSLLKTRLDHLTLKSIDNLRNCSSYTESMRSGKIGTKYSPWEKTKIFPANLSLFCGH